MNKLVSKLLIILFVFSTFSCSGTKQKNASEGEEGLAYGSKEYVDAFVSHIRPRWFKTVKRFQLLDSKNEIMPHRFFDVAPAIDLKKKTANIIITTPEGSLYGNDLDTASGQLFVARKFCDQSDKMKKFGGIVSRPPFSIGVVPRVLDQLNLPQKVIVFGGKDYFKSHYLTHFFDVRIIGAYIEQSCPYGACLKKDQWNSRLVLVAVQAGHQKYEQVKDLADLHKLVDWKYVKAFIENGYGANKVSDNFYPGYRMGAMVTAGQALAFMEKNSTIFTIERLGKMRLSCYKLYDYLWKDLSFISTDEIVAKNKKEVREKAMKLRSTYAKSKKKVEPFYKRFIRDFKQYHDQFKTCSQYISATNINYSPERNWFFAFYQAFHLMHELGYTFECKGNRWAVNPFVAKDVRAIPLKDELRNCSSRNIDVAMETAVTTLDIIRKRGRKSFRYIDYDKGLVGTHLKMYSWIPTGGKYYSCSNKEDREFSLMRPSFPHDIHWKKRGVEGKTKSTLGDIIY